MDTAGSWPCKQEVELAQIHLKLASNHGTMGRGADSGRARLPEGASIVHNRPDERGLCLTEEEAIGLLDIVLLCPEELTMEQRAAMLKLSDFCRQFLRDGDDPPSGVSLAGLKALAAGYAA